MSENTILDWYSQKGTSPRTRKTNLQTMPNARAQGAPSLSKIPNVLGAMSPFWPNEKAFTRSVTQAAQRFGWKVHHVPFYEQRARPLPGFPDLCLCNGKRLIFAELKTDKGKLTDAQQRWITALRGAGQEVYVWRFRDWDALLETLQR